MTSAYSYEIVLVDEKAQCMEVKYMRENQAPVHVGVRLPADGETLEQLMDLFLPAGFLPVQEAMNNEPDLYPDVEIDMQAANDFLSSKNAPISACYGVSMYNITTQELLANLFQCENQLVKVLDGIVLEWYEAGVIIEDEPYMYVSKDLQTGAVVDKYIADQRGLVKLPNSADTAPTITKSGTFAEMPAELQALAEGFAYKNRICGWSVKPYGFIVEYVRA